jgi:hypothetical protein
MPASFNLELDPGKHVALDTMVSSSDNEHDMARMEGGTVVDGLFWGKLNIVHDGEKHEMEFSGARLQSDEYNAKPTMAKCHLSILVPTPQDCSVELTLSPHWKLAIAWPPAEANMENKVMYSLQVYPGGVLVLSNSGIVSTALYYEVV